MMARSTKRSNQRPDTLMQDRISPNSNKSSCNARPDHTFGSFASFPPTRRVRFAPRADIRPMPAFVSTRPAARSKTNLLKLRRPVRPGCRAVRDSTLAAWYRSLYAPRTGGAYDSHHRTAGIAGRTRRGGGVAAGGAGAAAIGGAGNRVARHRVARGR